MRESWRQELAESPQYQVPWRWEGQSLGTDAGGVGKGQDLWHFPSSWKQRHIPVSNSSNLVPPTRVAGAEGNPAGLWPHPATQPLFQTMSVPAGAITSSQILGTAPPCPNNKPSPLGMVPLTPQTLSSSSKGPCSTTQEPARPCLGLEWAKVLMPLGTPVTSKMLSQTLSTSSSPEIQWNIPPKQDHSPQLVDTSSFIAAKLQL